MLSFLQRTENVTPMLEDSSTMLPSIQCQDPTTPFGLISHLFSEAGKAKARITSPVMANHDSTIRELRWSVVDSCI